MRTLIIEVSTERCSVIIADTKGQLIERLLPYGYQQSKLLMPSIIELLNAASLQLKDLDCIGVGVGPGSYTGIRIGAAVAKTLAYASKIPLVGFCSLCAFTPDQEGPFAVLIDAKISGTYLIKGIKDSKGIQYISPPEAIPLENLAMPLSGITQLITPSKLRLQDKLSLLFPDAGWQWQEKSPDSQHLIRLVKEKLESGQIADPNSLELLYLRKTQAEISRVSHSLAPNLQNN